jgi:adenylate kinase
MARYIVLLGPPGAGKGTQAELIATTLNLPHISSGDLFRENLRGQTELGKKAEGFIKRGELVPDDLTIAMVRDRITRPDCAAGALLDGFPRTPAQAEALSVMLAEMGGQVDVVPYIAVPMEILMERLTGRWTCKTDQHVYHVKFNPPQVPGKCDIDGTDLYQREDDKPEAIERRLSVYQAQTAPLIAYYKERGLLVEIDGTKSIDDVSTEMRKVILKGA